MTEKILCEEIKSTIEIIIRVQKQLYMIQTHKDRSYKWTKCDQGWMKAGKHRSNHRLNSVHVHHLHKILHEGYQTLQKHGRVPRPPLDPRKSVFVKSRFKFS